MTRSIKRKIKKNKKRQAEQDLKEKIGMFSQLEDSCLVCEKVFDKQDKKMVQSWYVVIRKEQNKVNLYCPGCWTKASNMVAKLKEEIDEEQS